MLIGAFSYLYLLIPLVLIQYGLTLFCLVKLVLLELQNRKKFWIWNFFVLLVPVVGVATFLICYYSPKISVLEKPQVDTKDNEQDNGV